MAGRKPGTPKTGGRQPGVLNKNRQSLLDKCDQRGIDLFDSLLELAQDSDKAIRFAAIKEASQYVYAKRRSLEHSGSIDPKMAEAAEQIALMSKEQQIEALEEELKKLKE